jgi:hypothetical protein
MFKVLTDYDEKLIKRHTLHYFTEEIMKAANLNNNSNEVLFQKMGNTWYVFTEVKGDMVYSALPTGMDPLSTKLELFEVIEEHMTKVSKHYGSRVREVSA